MGDKFDLEAALKENPEHEVAQYLAQQHGIDRDAFLKEGHTDADFIKEFGAMPLPSNVEQTNNAVTSPPSKPSATVNAMAGAVAAGVPLSIHGIRSGVQSFVVGDALKQLVKNQQQAAPTPPATPSRFLDPKTVSDRFRAVEGPRGQGVVNWADNQYVDRGYTGVGKSQPQEALLHEQINALEAKNPGFKVKPGTADQLIPVHDYDSALKQHRANMFNEGLKFEDMVKAKEAVRQRRLEEQARLQKGPVIKQMGKGALNAFASPTAKRFATGYNAADFLQSEHVPEQIVAGVGTVAPWVEKIVPQKYKPAAKILGGGISALAPAFNSVLHNLYNPEKPVEEHASGGAVGLDMLNEYTAPMMGGLKQAYNSPVVQKTMKYGGKGLNTGLQGLGMASAFSVPENIEKGEYVDAGVNTLNAAASAAAMMPELAGKIGAAGLGRIFPYLMLYDVLKPGKLNTGEDEELGRMRALQNKRAEEIYRAEVDSGVENPTLWKSRIDPTPKSVVFKHAEGGPIQHYVDGGSIRNAAKAAHELGGVPGRLTDFLQHHINKFIVPTQSDRMGLVGGPNFSANSLSLPEYKGFVWGSGNKGTATGITNLAKDERFGGPENQIFMPLLGHQNQHQSNQIVYNHMLEDFFKNQNKLSPELKAKLEDFMARGGGLDPKTGLAKFSKFPGLNLNDKDELALLGKSFENRKLIAQHVFGGKDIGGKKSQIIQYQDILNSLSDPTVKGAPSFALGPRAFSLTGKVHPEARPDLNAAFPHLLEGQDLGHAFNPVPSKLILPDFQNQWRVDKNVTGTLKSGELKEPGYFENTVGYIKKGDTERTYPRQQVNEQLLDTLYKEGHAEGGLVENFQVGGLAKAKQSISQIPEVAKALEAYLKGNISSAERMAVVNKHLPIRKWDELPPNYTDEQIRNALMSNKQPLALAEVPAGMQVGNRLDIPAYTQNGVYVDTVHNAQGKPISYNRTGHLNDVNFESRPNQAVRVGLGTKEQALTPMGAEIGSGKSPFALMKGTNVGTHDDEVRRMMEEYLKDPRWTQIGMDPRRHSQFFDKSTGSPVFSAEQKLQSGPLVMVPKHGLESTHWEDPRLELKDFPAKHYAEGGEVEHFQAGGLSKINTLLSAGERLANKAKAFANRHPDVPDVMYHGTAADINQFVPKQAGATFLSPTPKFAGDFSDASENYLATDLLKKLKMEDEDKFNNLKKSAIRIANKSGSSWGDELETLARNQLPTRANILPLHVNATNPFDFQNQKHLDALKNELLNVYHPDLPKFDPRAAERQVNYLKGGNWSEIESPSVQQAIKNMGHDSFWVNEGGQKNLGIYDPNQIKSAIGNRGTYDFTNPDITKAEGGPIHMAKGGVLSFVERLANKAKFLENSVIKNPVYHGTTNDILSFDTNKAGNKTGNVTGHFGIFASNNPQEASRYAEQWGNKGGNVMPLHIQLNNPYEMPYSEFNNFAMGPWNKRMSEPGYDPKKRTPINDMAAQRAAAEAIEKHTSSSIQDVLKRKQELMDLGHDGVIVNIGGNKEYIAFNPTQIKSAIGNQGTFDPLNPNITKAEGGPVKTKKAKIPLAMIKNLKK